MRTGLPLESLDLLIYLVFLLSLLGWAALLLMRKKASHRHYCQPGKQDD
ncbi:hypothetical protein ACILPN_07060 [Yersinia wautersii]|uniref:Uncharacterized protein n=1 Tax=Yersinia pseudotuberculosis TaxID=633 RepID=A0A380Q3U5_YERPU|nr:hypothetical protein [Yersinia pseudotuberculosis]SUP80448.1 Uncharacterised protein [Yersinia pseudotuberculosis]